MIPRLLANPVGTVTGAMGDDPAAVKAAYRLFDAPQVTHDAVLAPHRRFVREALELPGLHLLIEDTTSVVPAAQGAGGLGPADNDGDTRGFWLHSTLAVRIDFDDATSDANRVQVLGLLAQHAWVRKDQRNPRGESKRAKLARDRESDRWAASLTAALGRAPAVAGRCVLVADREGDSWEIFERCRAAAVGWVIRAAQDRALADDRVEATRLRQAVEAMPVREVRVADLPRSQGQPARRDARLELRYGELELRAPYRPGKPPGWTTMKLNVVHVREVGVAAGGEGVEWMLLTDRPVRSTADAWRVVAIYKRRWLIEEFHKGLKTGAGVERSQLATADKLMAWCAVLSVVTTWLLRQKLTSADPEQPPLRPGVDAEADLLALLERRQPGVGAGGWTARTLTRAIAKAGGFLGRKGDGDPGWLTIWRGWTRLRHQLIGYRLAMATRSG